MKKLYTEEQYNDYSEFMERIANTDIILEGYNICEELGQWIEINNITEDMEKQMDIRIEHEYEEEINKCKVINFPKLE